MTERYDVFVGNLTFNTTEEQLREVFQFVGPVKQIRLQTDKETGKAKGFAFVEYYDSNSAIAAIKHLDQTELNGRKIKVGFSSQSNLKDIARQSGHVVPGDSTEYGGPNSTNFTLAQLQHRQQLEQNVINSLKLHEAWDILEAMKTLVMDESRGQKVRKLLEAYPQIISAIYEIENRLGISLPSHVQQQQQMLQQQKEILAAGNSNPSSHNMMPLADNANPMIAGRGFESDYYGPGPLGMEEPSYYGRDQAYYGEEVLVGGMGGGGYIGGIGGGNDRDRMDMYGPSSGPSRSAALGGGRVSRFGAPDHAAFMMNVNNGGNYDHYGDSGNNGNEMMYLQDYPPSHNSHNHKNHSNHNR